MELINQRSLVQKNEHCLWTKIKAATSKSIRNHHFDVLKETRVKCDASYTGLGASMEQNHNGVCKSTESASCFLSGTEIKYSIDKQELLRLVWSLNHYNCLLVFKFKILIDTKH